MGHRVCGGDGEERRRSDGTGRDIPPSVPQRCRCDPSDGWAVTGTRSRPSWRAVRFRFRLARSPIRCFVGVRTGIARVLSICEQVRDEAGPCVGGGDDGFRGALCGAPAAGTPTQGTVAGMQALGGQPEGRGGPVGGLVCAGAQGLAARDVLGGGQTKPGGNVRHGGPPMPSQADVGEDRLDGEPRQAIDLGQVHTGQSRQIAAHIEGGFIPLGLVPSLLA